MRDRILIKTAGRTGSHVLAQQHGERLNLLRTIHNHDYPAEELYSLQGPVVVHDHTMNVPDNAQEWDLVVSLRRSVYDQAVSFCIAKSTDNFGHAPARSGEYIIDDELFLITLKNYKVVNYYWQLIAQLYSWRSVETVYWEDLQPLDRTYGWNHPSAGNNRVVNHDQLQALAQKYLDNHNWAIDQAAHRATRYIGTIGRVAARALLVGD